MHLNNLVIVLLLSWALSGSAQEVSSIEPPFWWVGMEDTSLQLVLQGNDIFGSTVTVDRNDIKVVGVENADSKNYLFVNLEVSKDAKAGEIKLNVKKGIISKSYAYNLMEREKGSSDREGFNSSDIIYLITPDRFVNGDPSNDEVEGLKEGLDRSKEYGRHGGDIKGIMDHLDYLSEMGYTQLWLNPVLENDMEQWSYHGYSTTDYYKIDPRFGSNALYKEMVYEAKKRGIGIIMDQIANHCGGNHPWISDPPFNDWFNYQNLPYKGTNHRKTTVVDPYRSQIDRQETTDGWFVPTMPDLNQRNPFMAKFIIQNSIWWVEYAGLSGIRQDTYSYPDRDFMSTWSCALMNEYPNFNIVGEEWVDDPSLISYWQRGKINHDGYTSCLPSLMDFPLMFDLKRALQDKESWGEGWIKLYKNLANDYLYPDPSNLVIFGDNHDISRIATELNGDEIAIKMAMVYIMTMRGIPQVYYGTEIKMTHPGTDSHGAIREDFPGGWNGDETNAFTQRNLSKDQIDFQNWFKKLMRWRKENSVIHHGRLTHYSPLDGVYVYFRYNEDKTVMVILNKNEEPYTLDLSRFKESLDNYSKYDNVLLDHSGELGKHYHLAERGATILSLK